MALFKKPIHDEGIDDKHHADERLPQTDGRVFVVVAARGARPVVIVVVIVILVVPA